MSTSPLLSLPTELLHHIFTFLDLKSLTYLSAVNHRLSDVCSDDLLWKPAYKSQHWNVHNKFFKGKDLFMQAFLNLLKKEYRLQHPRYKTIQELAAKFKPNQTDYSKATDLYNTLSTASEKDRIRFVKGLIASNKLHQLVLEHYSWWWLTFLEENIISKAPEIVLQIITSSPFQKKALSSGNDGYSLYQILRYSKEGPVVLFDYPELEPLQATFSFALSDINNQEDRSWLGYLIAGHPNSYRLIIKHPEMLQLLTFNAIESLVKNHPDLFSFMGHSWASRRFVVPDKSKYHLLITPEGSQLKSELFLLKKSLDVSIWLYNQDLESFSKFITQVLSLKTKEQLLPVFSVRQLLHDKSVAVQPVLIPCLKIAYLLSSFHRDLVKKGELTLLELLQLTPSEFLQNVPLDKTEEAASALRFSSSVESWKVDDLKEMEKPSKKAF